MQPSVSTSKQRYAKCIEVSKRIRWDIERDVIRGREFDVEHKFLPDGLSFVDRIASLITSERRLLSQIQGRTYANMFEQLTGEQMPDGYCFLPQPNDVAQFVLGKSTWAVLALTCHIEIFSQVHYRQSIESDQHLSPLYKDVFFFHWKEESQHAIIDELEWMRENSRISDAERDSAVDDLIALVAGIDGTLQQQAAADAEYFSRICGRSLDAAETSEIRSCVLAAYRWQYIVSGVKEARFSDLLTGMLEQKQAKRVFDALAPIIQ